MVAKVETNTTVGFLGKSHNVMAIHVHNHLANNKWPQRLEAFWPWLIANLVKYDVTVLMGDFNMSLFQVIPQLRSCGVEVACGAWFPWKSFAGTAMSDSCGMFFLNMPGEYALCKGLGDLHDDDESGILTRALPAVAGAPREHGFDRCAVNGGPGQILAAYLPKQTDSKTKLAPTLTLSASARHAVAAMGKGKGEGTRQCFKVREKRLSADLWRCDGKQYNGSHFPLCAFTQNVSRRSVPKLIERAQARGRGKGSGRAAARAEPQREPSHTSRSCGDAGVAAAPTSSSNWAGAGQAGAGQAGVAAAPASSSGDQWGGWSGGTQWGGWNYGGGTQWGGWTGRNG
jgi:hypothetical protein